jgi:hypothetical protein
MKQQIAHFNTLQQCLQRVCIMLGALLFVACGLGTELSELDSDFFNPEQSSETAEPAACELSPVGMIQSFLKLSCPGAISVDDQEMLEQPAVGINLNTGAFLYEISSTFGTQICGSQQTQVLLDHRLVSVEEVSMQECGGSESEATSVLDASIDLTDLTGLSTTL